MLQTYSRNKFHVPFCKEMCNPEVAWVSKHFHKSYIKSRIRRYGCSCECTPENRTCGPEKHCRVFDEISDVSAFYDESGLLSIKMNEECRYCGDGDATCCMCIEREANGFETVEGHFQGLCSCCCYGCQIQDGFQVKCRHTCIICNTWPQGLDGFSRINGLNESDAQALKYSWDYRELEPEESNEEGERIEEVGEMLPSYGVWDDPGEEY